jgi:hypothetical protein
VLNKIFLKCAGCVLQHSGLNNYRSYSQHTSTYRPALWLHLLDIVNALHFPSVKTFEWDSSQVSLHMYLLLKLTVVLPPYQSVKMKTLYKQFHRQQSVRTGEFSVLFDHKAEHISLGSRYSYVAYKITNTSYHSRPGGFSSMTGISLPAHCEIGHILYRSTRLTFCATSRKVAGSIPYALIGHWVDLASHRNEYQEYLLFLPIALRPF